MDAKRNSILFRSLLSIIILLCIFSCDFHSAEDYITQAEKLEQQENYEEAIVFLDMAIEKDPKNVIAYLNRGADKSMLEDYEGAIKDYVQVTKLDSDNTLAYFNKGLNKARLKNYLGAVREFDMAIKTKGSEIIYINKVENSFFDTGFEFDVDMAAIRFERGLARYQIDSLKSAFVDFSFCINEEYQLPYSYYWRGIIYITVGKLNEGCLDMNKAKQLGDSEAQSIIDEYCN